MMATKAQCISRHTAFIYDRGGKRRIAPIGDISSIRWSRVRDNVSEANVRLEGESCSKNATLLAEARSKRHELVIFRGEERVWEGPISRIATHSTWAEFHAKDPLWYLFGQPMTQKWSNATVGGVSHATAVTQRLEDIIEYEMSHGRTMFFSNTAPDAVEAAAEWVAAGGVLTPTTGGWNVSIPAFESDDIWPAINILPHLDVRHFPNEARTAAETLPYQMTVGMHLQNFARTGGIDFTALGRKILIWDVSRHIGALPTMTTSNFTADVIVTEYGMDHTQVAYSIGQNGAYGQALNLKNLAYYGPWSAMYTPYNEEGTEAPTQAELDSQAQRNIKGRSPAPIEVRVPDNSTIIVNDRINLNDLVPGVQVPLRATLNYRPLAQQQKIDVVNVSEAAEGENIQITLTPATRPDSDEVE